MRRKFSKTFRIALCAVFLLSITNAVQAQQVIPKIELVSPQYGATDIDTLTKIKVTFNASMNKKSVEKNFYVFPEISGKISWTGKTLVFSPDKPLLPSTSYFVSFSSGIKAADGIPLAVTYFSTPAEGVCVGPEGSINILSINADRKDIKVQGSNPIWAADNKSIVFEDKGKIWKVDANGKNIVQLVSDEESYMAGIPEPNYFSDSIAFVGTNAAGTSNVYVVDVKTKIPRQLTSFFEPNLISHISWSPDGLYLAFLRAGQVWIMNQDGKDLNKLTNDELTCKGNFAWSPGGTKIAFSGQENVWIGDIYSTELRKISFDSPKTGLLDWSQNNRIVFESEGLTIMNADGSDEIRVPTAAENPQWIDRGNSLSFILNLYNDSGTSQIWSLTLDGKTKKKIGVINAAFPSISWSRNIGFWNLFSS